MVKREYNCKCGKHLGVSGSMMWYRIGCSFFCPICVSLYYYCTLCSEDKHGTEYRVCDACNRDKKIREVLGD